MLLVAFLLCSAMVVHGRQQQISNSEREKLILDKILGGSYDSHVRPRGANGTTPTIVNVNMYMRSIDRIDDYNMEYSGQFTFREQWLDARLRFDTLKEYYMNSGKLRYVTLKDSSRVWMPDLFFSNEKQSHTFNMFQPNVYVRIHPDGEVLYSIRISVTLSCPMVLLRFPFDKQTCSLRMASYAFTTEDIIFKWKRADPVQVTSDLHLPRFALIQFTTDYCDSQTNTGIYSCLRVDFLFKREPSYYITKYFLPYGLLVVASWILFWLDHKATSLRISLGIAILLTMIILISGSIEKLPLVSYSTLLDFWTKICLAFVLAALLEVVLVNFISRLGQPQENLRNDDRQRMLDQNTADDASDEGATVSKVKRPGEVVTLTKAMESEPIKQGRVRSCWSKLCPRSSKIDLVSRIIFPLFFGLFCYGYFNIYSSHREYAGNE